MLNQIQADALAQMSAEERKEQLDALAEQTRTANGSSTAYLKSRIKAFELRYEMTSEAMLDKLKAGTQKETADIAEWLFLLDALEGSGE